MFPGPTTLNNPESASKRVTRATSRAKERTFSSPTFLLTTHVSIGYGGT
jgi:hypothetical protein